MGKYDKIKHPSNYVNVKVEMSKLTDAYVKKLDRTVAAIKENCIIEDITTDEAGD